MAPNVKRAFEACEAYQKGRSSASTLVNLLEKQKHLIYRKKVFSPEVSQFDPEEMLVGRRSPFLLAKVAVQGQMSRFSSGSPSV